MRVKGLKVALIGSLLLLLTGCSSSEPPPQSGPDWLWVAVWGSNKVVAFDADQVEHGAAGTEAVLAIGLGPTRLPYGLTFDAGGNGWVSTQGGEILKFAAADITSSGTPLPAAELTTEVTHVPVLAFAPDGSLWGTSGDRIMGWRAATLATGGSPAPDVVFTTTAEWDISYPNDLAFDGEGGMWVVGGDLVRFSPAQLAVGGAVAPEVIITSDGTSLVGPTGLAFDAAGDLWVVSMVGSKVEKFRAADLAVSGSPAAIVTLTGPGTMPIRVRFDGEDNMWVSSVYAPGFGPSGHVAMILPQHRVTSGAAVITVQLTELGSFDVGGGIAFRPGPAE